MFAEKIAMNVKKGKFQNYTHAKMSMNALNFGEI